MKKELIGLLICILVISSAVLPAAGAIINRNVRLEEQQIAVEKQDQTLTSLSDQDFAELEKQLEEMDNKFYSEENREERIDIIKETTVLMDEYGQLPSDLSVDHALQLVDERCMDPEFIEFLDRPFDGTTEVDNKDGSGLTDENTDPLSIKGVAKSSQETSVVGSSGNDLYSGSGNGNFLSDKSVLVNGQHVKNGDGSLADGINMWCESNYLVDIILRNDVFHIMVHNDNDEEIWHSVSITVKKPNGDIIFDEFTTTCPFPMKSHTLDFWTFWRFPDFREKGHMFGFFDIYWEFYVLNDGSCLKEKYRGFIFGIAAIIFTPRGIPFE